MKVSRRRFLGFVARGLSAIGLLGLSFSGFFLKKGAPERVYSSIAGEVRIAKLGEVPEPGTVKFTTADGPGILVHFRGQLRAFSASCTHMGCPVSGKELESKGLLVCPCHGSAFDPLTGEMVSGPAPRPLWEIEVEVRKGAVYAIG
jgi:Rieske Fe-S protein